MRKPTAPKAPRKPTKPSKPEKVLTYLETVYLDLYSSGDKITFAELLDKVPDGVDHKDIYLSMDDDSYGCCGCCSSNSVRAYYPKEMENKQYDKQMKAYEKKLARYNDKLEDFNAKLGEWEIRYAEYLDELERWTSEQTDREIKALERKLKKLKKVC